MYFNNDEIEKKPREIIRERKKRGFDNNQYNTEYKTVTNIHDEMTFEPSNLINQCLDDFKKI